jgi:hypothetical protein
LRTLNDVVIHEGRFYVQAKRRYLADPLSKKPRHLLPLRTESVIIPEEKGSDVNLATYLLFDAFRNRYDTAIVVSNDSDLAAPIRLVCEEMQKSVILLNPHSSNPAFHLQGIPGVAYRRVRLGPLQACQFPHRLHDSHGVIEKPSSW